MPKSYEFAANLKVGWLVNQSIRKAVLVLETETFEDDERLTPEEFGQLLGGN